MDELNSGADPSLLPRDEYDRMWRVLDTSLTGHSLLRDRFQRRARVLTLLILGSSILLTGLAFFTTEDQISVGSLSGPVGVWLGSLSAFIFFVSVADLVIDWRGRAWRHAHAVKRLSLLKADFRGVTFGDALVDSGGTNLRSEYERTMASVAVIPEAEFLAVKAKHHKKVAISKRIDQHPGAPLVYVRLLVTLDGFWPSRKGSLTRGQKKS